ncbi:hypothetical protein MY04_05720 (plasmid) [Flammeovirga sp. MY04]|uniref:hypothetical protein n=1 Tax=Flammeovirga sp. MY04 TaxID=1191459 RepID=UPI0008062E86|nr:hypothetical protein [Flammeovirga sp. MY04]ANQ52874.1 hypothetical protein MY04_05720 [Flammeovirga sp. MY04]
MKLMNRKNFITVLFLALTVFSCKKDETVAPKELTKKERQEITRKELAVVSNSTFETIVTSKWELVEFVPSSQMKKAAASQDLYAVTTIKKGKQALDFGMTLSFEKLDKKYSLKVKFKDSGDPLEKKIGDYQEATTGVPGSWGLIPSAEFYMAEIRAIMAAPFAADDLSAEDIQNSDTGEINVEVIQNDVSKLNYENMLLNYSKIIKENKDRIYLNDNQQLIVEATDNTYGTGTSHYVYKKVVK